MGPILDVRGLDQVAIYLLDAFKIYKTEQTTTSQQSLLEVSVYIECFSFISLADDTALMSDSLVNLNNLLHLTSYYDKKYGVEKTNLIKFQPISREEDFDMEVSQLKMCGDPIPFSSWSPKDIISLKLTIWKCHETQCQSYIMS